MSSYSQTVDWLFNQFPSYQNIGAKAYKPDLDNVSQLLNALENPEKTLRFIHVAGTNGKGSTTHILASICQENGLKTGLFTSPHLVDFRERIKINGIEISEASVIDFVTKIKQLPLDYAPSFFEISFAMSLYEFQKQGCDICVIETGLGGRLDATNIITPLISVITNIGLDHQQFLGETRKEIAFEKAGIIKSGIPVVICEKDTETTPVFELQANKQNSEILWVDFSNPPKTDLFGAYQEKNAATAYTTAKYLQTILNLTNEATLSGMLHTKQNTGLRGRMEVVNEKPLTIIDGAHNEAGIIELMKAIKLLKYNKLHFVYGASSDKNIVGIMAHFPLEAMLYFTEFKGDRSSKLERLKMQSAHLSQQKQYFTMTQAAFEMAKKEAKDADLIVVFGSLFLIAEFF